MKRFGKTIFSFMMAVLIGSTTVGAAVYADGSVTLYTPYTSLSAPPGETISYSIEVINNGGGIQNVDLSVSNMPEQWEYDLTASGRPVQRVAVKPNEPQTVNLDVKVPLEVKKGGYRFSVTANGTSSLPLTINVSEQGTYKTELTTEQPNMEGHADSTFNFSTTLRNRTAEKQLYALRADVPRGWDVQYTVDGKNVTSVNVDANSSKDISIAVQPPNEIKAGTYKIPIQAAANSTSASTELEVVITGTYNLELSTPNGNLSTEVTAGDEKKIDLTVKNTGTAPLRDIELSATTPANWEVTFDTKNINVLEPGKSANVQATIKADKKAIAGDYVVSMKAQTPEKSAEAQFRVAVKTSVLWGWIGILIILGVIGGVYYLFRTYGRR